MKLYILLFLAVFLISCDNQSAPEQKPQQNLGYPDPAPPGIWDPSQPQPYPQFDLPEGCEHNPDNPWQARCLDGDLQLDLGVLSKPESDTVAKDWRNSRYNHVFCQAGEQKDVWIDCRQSFQKSSLQFHGNTLYLLQYNGVMGDLDQQVTELFWDSPDWSEALTIQGDFQKATTAWQSIIGTLHYQYSVPNLSFQ